MTWLPTCLVIAAALRARARLLLARLSPRARRAQDKRRMERVLRDVAGLSRSDASRVVSVYFSKRATDETQ